MPSLYEKLNQLRETFASNYGVEVFKIWNNETQRLLAERRPASVEELSLIKGIGPARLEKFGKSILSVIEGADLGSEVREHYSGDEKLLSVGIYLDFLNKLLVPAKEAVILGEVGSIKLHPSGVYGQLRDTSGLGVLDLYIPTYIYESLSFKPEEGQVVKVTGVAQIRKNYGRFSVRVETLRLAGEGILRQAYEALKTKLAGEGLFERKRELPALPKRIGLITSKSGAVIDDFRNNVIKTGLKLHLISVRVEGLLAKGQIIKALEWFAGHHNEYDCIVLMRGGGSIEDLQAFNDEDLVRKVFASPIPVIVAIGHDKDVPLASLVSDMSVSTPTAAAAIINERWSNAAFSIERIEVGLNASISEMFYDASMVLVGAENVLHRLVSVFNTEISAIFSKFEVLGEQLNSQVRSLGEELEYKSDRLYLLTLNLTDKLAIALDSSERLLNNASPQRMLDIGYSLVKIGKGKVVRSIKDLEIGQTVDVELKDGKFNSKITEIK